MQGFVFNMDGSCGYDCDVIFVGDYGVGGCKEKAGGGFIEKCRKWL